MRINTGSKKPSVPPAAALVLLFILSLLVLRNVVDYNPRGDLAATADHPENLQGKGEVLNTGNGHASGADERSAPRLGDQAGEWKYDTDTDGARGQEMHVLPPGEGARIAIVTMYFGSSLYLKEITGPNKAIYAKQHGYDFFDAYENAQVRALVDEVVAKGTPNDLLFVKLKGILHFLPDYDWVFWSDADALFLNFEKTLEPYLFKDRDVVFTAGPPHSKRWRGVLNSGHFLVRNNDFGAHFMQATWDHRVKPCTNLNLFNGWLALCDPAEKPGTGCCAWGEQGALMDLLEIFPAWKKHVEYVGFREFNSQFPWWGPGDLVFHLPGRTNKERIRLFAEIIVAANFTDGTVPNMHRVLEPEPNPDHLLGMDYSQLNTKEKQSGGWFPTVFVQPGAHPHLGSS